MAKTKTPIFRPRARLMLLLGDQLIRDAGIAVFELVKNAYDADATRCDVRLEHVHEDREDACVVIQDDGEGMSLETINSIWLSPGTRHRLSQRQDSDDKKARTKKFHRLPLGEKGVGRFAVHKLGDQVEMITRAKNSKEVVVTIDWRSFDSDEPLEAVAVQVSARDPQVFTGRKHGTRLSITNLRERPWTRRRVRALHRAATSICSPIAGPGSFEASLTLAPDPGKWLTGLLTPKQVMRAALFRCKGRIHDGKITYNYEFRPPAEMDRVESRKEASVSVPFPQLPEGMDDERIAEEDERIILLDSHKIGLIEFDFYVFDRDRTTLALMSGDSKTLTDFLNQNGGVRVYRDGVRVYDFGEPGNDWLDLGGRRVNVPTKRIGNNQIIGVVRLKLDQSQDLIEKTNREGFVENQAYVMFCRAIKFAVKQAESERNHDKERIRRAYTKAKKKEPVLSDLQALSESIDELQLPKDDNEHLKKFIDQIDVQYREVLDRLLTAAGAGLNLSIILHEVDKNIGTLYSLIERGDQTAEVREMAKQLSDMVDTLTWLTRQSGKSKVDISELIDNCLFVWRFRFDRHSITTRNGIEMGDPSFFVRANRRLILTALMNLVDNAIYWLGTKARDRRLYIGTSFELTGKPGIVVADNGPGFSDPFEYLTMPFFTRKPDGMGLGLHLAEEIMKTQSGRLAFPEQGDISLPSEFNGAILLLEFEKEA
ncbi:MAG: ATP-binding protein [Planctomycetota bacterium]|nr:MAG: ATP-binding protein [Planctomycetota bacterium]REJ87322.1 MAG: ATP-binding protein [Planctomycetota bacterium]REK22665.1 MAG: ATP-binding protein [Planctomycetota bacterium]REK42502.1 MAG: ATP-binding protein [Planctomycetota bacterium]